MNARVLARLYLTQRLEPLGVRVLSMPDDPIFLVYDGAESPAVVPCPLATHRSNTNARSKEDRETEGSDQADRCTFRDLSGNRFTVEHFGDGGQPHATVHPDGRQRQD